MSSLIIYFSYTGKTKELAENKAREDNMELLELTQEKRRGKFLTYTAGSVAAMAHKNAKLNAFNTDLSAYDRIVLAMPIWAGSPAPPLNNILPLIKTGCKVELIFTSGSGNSKSSGDYVKEKLQSRGIEVTSVIDVKTAP